MSHPLPYGWTFSWVDPENLGNIANISKHDDIGYILDCDIQYPEEILDLHYDLPLLLAKSEIPPVGKHTKLIITLKHKERNVAHFCVVQQALELSLQVTKIHRAIQFSQSCWLKPYIDSNIK